MLPAIAPSPAPTRAPPPVLPTALPTIAPAPAPVRPPTSAPRSAAYGDAHPPIATVATAISPSRFNSMFARRAGRSPVARIGGGIIVKQTNQGQRRLRDGSFTPHPRPLSPAGRGEN